MSDTTILSTLHQQTEPVSPLGRQSAWVFDACHVGVVLRAVLVVQAVVGVGLMFRSPSFWSWLLDVASWSAATQPAVLGWLIAGCLLKKWLGQWPMAVQVAIGLVSGACAGVGALGLLRWLGLVDATPVWASAFSGVGLAGVLLAGLVWRARAQLPANTTARLAELQARIRPHFLFNSLNSAIALVRAEPAKAEALLEDLSELFRSALAESAQHVSLAEEVELAQRYLAIERVRFGDRLRLHWSLDPAAHAALLPPLILQPLVENAVKHGVEPSVSGAEIWVSTQRRGDRVVIKVRNTCPGGVGSKGQGLALANVGERLALMHDVHASMRSGWVDGMFQVRMEVPA